MNSIQYGNRKIIFKIERSNRRKTVGIYINPSADVVVYSPLFLEVSKIEEIVRKKARWIIKKQELIKNQRHPGSSKEFVSGEAFLYLGRQYRLKVIRSVSEKEESCKLINGRFLANINSHLNGERVKESVRQALVDWYLNRAQEKIPERVKLYARQMGKWPERVEIKNHKR